MPKSSPVDASLLVQVTILPPAGMIPLALLARQGLDVLPQ